MAEHIPAWLKDAEACAVTKPDRPPPALKAKWVWVDPGVAEAFAVLNTWNRQIREERVNEYADLMTNGLWDEGTPQTIVFDKDKKQADGQHRGRGVIKSGRGYWFLVVWDVEPSARLNIDRGGIRTSADNAVMAGYGDLFPGDSKRAQELANAFIQGMRTKKVSLGPAELVSVYEQYGDVLTKATNLFANHPKRSFFSRATMRAVVARALYHGVSENVLDGFIEILVTGYSSNPKPSDRSVIAFRNDYVEATTEKKKTKGGVNSNANASIYAKCAWALTCYLNGEVRKTIRAIAEDPWPIDPADRPALGADRMAGDERRHGARGPATDFLVETGSLLPA